MHIENERIWPWADRQVKVTPQFDAIVGGVDDVPAEFEFLVGHDVGPRLDLVGIEGVSA
jgi:hypothetical protein